MLVLGLLIGSFVMLGTFVSWVLARAAGRETPSPLEHERTDRKAA